MASPSGSTAQAADPGPGQITWLLAIPATIILLGALLWLADPLSALFEPKGEFDVFPSLRTALRPEPVEHARYLLALVAPFALAALIAWPAPRRLIARLPGPAADAVTLGIQLAALAFAVLCIVKQAEVPKPNTSMLDSSIFSTRQWAAAVLLALGALAMLCGPGRERADRWMARADGFLRGQGVGTAIAGAFSVLWLLAAFHTDRTIAATDPLTIYHLPLLQDEYAAVAYGQVPFADYTAIYNFILPLVAAPILLVTGTGVTSFISLMLALTLFGLIAIYRGFAEVVQRPAVALLLFAAAVGIAMFPTSQQGDNVVYAGIAFGNLPARYFAPVVLFWMVARHLRRGSPPLLAVFGFAGLGVLNNPEFGLGAFGAAVAALVIAAPREVSLGARMRTVAVPAAAGMAGALVSVTIVVLVLSGDFPDYGELFYFSDVFGRQGFALSPMPTLGLHIVLYATFAAALLAAAARALARPRSASPPASFVQDRVLTGALAYAGVQGLCAGVYYVGESEPTRIVALFVSWGIAICLLSVLTVGELNRSRQDGRALRRMLIPAFAVLTGLGLALISNTRLPSPVDQVQRINRQGDLAYELSPAIGFVRSRTDDAETVSMFAIFGHTVAGRAGVQDSFPFDDARNLKAEQMVDRAIEALRESGGQSIFVSAALNPEISAYLASQGFKPLETDQASALTLWVAPPAQAVRALPLENAQPRKSAATASSPSRTA